MTKADDLWEKYAYRSDSPPHVTYTEFLAALKEYGEAFRDGAVSVVLGGRFLHDDAPDAKWAKDCAAAIEKMKLP